MDLYLKINRRVFTTHWIEKVINKKWNTKKFLKLTDLLTLEFACLRTHLKPEEIFKLTRKSKKHHSVTLNGETWVTPSVYIKYERELALNMLTEELGLLAIEEELKNES